ncbi:hypothetical protein D1007_34323 [Hordeum vulgare]|nr:hypothetical protein D1007_34323 [Hordeum vulgare]
MSRAAAKKANSRGTWEGNIFTEGYIEVLRHRRMLPPAKLVAVRLPGGEGSLTPQDGEVVVFTEHCFRGFGLPVSDFFSRFLVHFGLQPHHFAANAILQLASFVTLCEGFLGIEPRLYLWHQLFFFKQQLVLGDALGTMKMTPCGASLVHHRTASGFPKLPLQYSVKKWQKGFCYVKNVDLENDCINLPPPFVIAPPRAKQN